MNEKQLRRSRTRLAKTFSDDTTEEEKYRIWKSAD